MNFQRTPNRRDFLRIGGAGAFALACSRLLQRRASSAMTKSKPRRACILIWLDGGPSHLETWDLKPDAPAEVRGPFQPISTSIPGIEICELLPQVSRQMQHVALVRSVTSPLGEHNLGAHYMLTGYKPTPVLEYPVVGSVVAHLEKQQLTLPAHIAIPDFSVGGGKITGNGFLPAAALPFAVHADPAQRDFQVPNLDYYPGLNGDRMERRRRFLQSLDRLSMQLDNQPSTADPQLDQAYRLITSSDAKQAFDLSSEPASIREAYGDRSIGQCCLLARRLIERGVPFVTVNNTGWDTHQNAYTRLKEGYTGAQIPVGLIPSLDLALAALVIDLQQRGMLEETLVVVMGEFGRTPKINTEGGRDHWPRVFSVALAGGGVNGGQVIGSSDEVGEGPQDRPITPSDLIATIYTLLGIDPHTELNTSDGRPISLVRGGEVIRELV